jgi:hypothetical protein
VWTAVRRSLASSATLHVIVGPSVVRAELVLGDRPTWAAQCAWGSDADLDEALARLAAELPGPCRRLTVALERPLVQLRTIPDLPPVRATVLPRLVAAQDRRFFRRNGQPLVTDAVWTGGPAARVARAAAVEQPVVEAIVAGARAAGLGLVAITPAGGPGALSLLPPAERRARGRLARTRLRRLAIATGAMWVLAGSLFAGRLAWERRQIDAALAALEEPLAAVRTARVELRSAESAVSAMQALDGQRGRALATLGAIAQALPDSVVATSLLWMSDGRGVLGGVGRRAADAVAALERAGAVAQPRLDGRIARESVAGRDWERFTIVFGPGTER